MRQVIVVVVVVVMVMACGGGGSGSVSIDQLFPEFLDAVCTEQVACAVEPDQATCTADRNVNETDILTVIADVKAGTIGYDAAKAGACLDELRNAACDNTAPRAMLADDPRLCILDVFTGTVALGGACNSLFECANSGSILSVNCRASDAQCDPTTTCCASTCVGLTTIGTGALGAACTGAAPCLPSLYCSDVTQTCKQPGAAAGDACEGFTGCEDPLVCHQDPQTMMGTCAALVPTGGACTADCADTRDFCDPTTMTCTRKVAVGGDCTRAQCVDYASCLDTTCVERSKISEACGTGGQTCLSNLVCVGNVCAVEPDGSACP